MGNPIEMVLLRRAAAGGSHRPARSPERNTEHLRYVQGWKVLRGSEGLLKGFSHRVSMSVARGEAGDHRTQG